MEEGCGLAGSPHSGSCLLSWLPDRHAESGSALPTPVPGCPASEPPARTELQEHPAQVSCGGDARLWVLCPWAGVLPPSLEVLESLSHVRP